MSNIATKFIMRAENNNSNNNNALLEIIIVMHVFVPQPHPYSHLRIMYT